MKKSQLEVLFQLGFFSYPQFYLLFSMREW